MSYKEQYDQMVTQLTTLAGAISITDRSGVIDTGSVSQTVMEANTSRKYMFFQNVSDANMWVNFDDDAAIVVDEDTVGSILLAPRAAWEMRGPVFSASLNVICATEGAAFTAKEG